MNGAFKDMEIVILNVTLWLLVLWMSSAKHTISEIYLEHVDRKDTKPLQENPPELTPEEKAKALDAASNMQIDATDQEADILKATPDIIFVCICKKVAMRLCIYILCSCISLSLALALSLSLPLPLNTYDCSVAHVSSLTLCLANKFCRLKRRSGKL